MGRIFHFLLPRRRFRFRASRGLGAPKSLICAGFLASRSPPRNAAPARAPGAESQLDSQIILRKTLLLAPRWPSFSRQCRPLDRGDRPARSEPPDPATPGTPGPRSPSRPPPPTDAPHAPSAKRRLVLARLLRRLGATVQTGLLFRICIQARVLRGRQAPELSGPWRLCSPACSKQTRVLITRTQRATSERQICIHLTSSGTLLGCQRAAVC